MSRFQVLPPYEARQFDQPPKFNRSEKKEFFVSDPCLTNIINRNTSNESKVGAMIQLGYFRATNKFFAVKDYRKSDIHYVCGLLQINKQDINMKRYLSSSKSNHKNIILEATGYQSYSKHKALFDESIKSMVKNQMLPRKIIFSVIDLFKHKKIETPSYDAFSRSITSHFLDFEEGLLNQLNSIIQPQHEAALDALIEKIGEDKKSRPLLTTLKNINQSEKPGQIKNSIINFVKLKSIYQIVSELFDEIDISSEAITYYGKLVIKYQLSQINQLREDKRRYLYLLAFVSHQYKNWQDIFLKIFKKAVRAFEKKAEKSIDTTYAENAPTKNELSDSINAGFKDYRQMVKKIERRAFNPDITDDKFRTDVQEILEASDQDSLDTANENVKILENMVGKERSNDSYFKAHYQLSRKLQNRVAQIVKHLDFEYDNSVSDLKSAIEYYQKSNTIRQAEAPDAFLGDEQHNAVYQNSVLNPSLYKSLLYVNIYQAINTGTISLKISYKYLPINAYMVEEKDWKENKRAILERLGIEEFIDIEKVLVKLQSKLDQKYYDVNELIKSGKNEYIKFNSQKDDSLIVRTPPIEKPDYEPVAEIIGTERNIPILELLMSLNKFSCFTTPLTHYKVKSKAKLPEDNLFIAGIFALGSDIGTTRLAKSAKGISINKLNNVVKWYFAIENLNAVNNLLTDFMNHMSLPDQFKKDKDFLHTSSDGRKRCISIESLLANYSYKYFGHGKGINIYTFVDERGILFYSTVFSSSDRDAPFVIDGLMHNESIKSDMHSTDTHGYSESIFAISHLLGTTFAPRIAKLSKQVLSSFANIEGSLAAEDYKILPEHEIDTAIIKANWDMILRLIVSIKTRNFRASTILKRLSSYTKEHPLQAAVKEFGRIIKSIFILNYIDDVALRQSIQKQLNKGELSNKFSKAVSFAPNQEINQTDKEDQEKAVICKMIIQNCIILWNYIELTTVLMKETNEEKKKDMLDSIKESSILTWRHINMHGTYDFTSKRGSNDPKITAQEALEFVAA